MVMEAMQEQGQGDGRVSNNVSPAPGGEASQLQRGASTSPSTMPDGLTSSARANTMTDGGGGAGSMRDSKGELLSPTTGAVARAFAAAVQEAERIMSLPPEADFTDLSRSFSRMASVDGGRAGGGGGGGGGKGRDDLMRKSLDSFISRTDQEEMKVEMAILDKESDGNGGNMAMPIVS